MLRLIRPILKVMAVLESDQWSISAVYEQFALLLQNEQYKAGSNLHIHQAVRTIIEERWKKCKSKAVKVVFLLDPTCEIDMFEPADKRSVLDDALALAQRLEYSESKGELRQQLCQFIEIKENWTKADLYENKKTPLSTRRTMSEHSRVLRDFARSVLCVPASSAASERSWSKHSHIHTQKRHNLDPATVEKVVFIYSNAGEK
jgi:hypothetical protein